MNFVKESVNQTPIVDTVFSIVAKAKEAKAKVGSENVVDATIGSLYDEEGTLVALDSVFSSLKTWIIKYWQLMQLVLQEIQTLDKKYMTGY